MVPPWQSRLHSYFSFPVLVPLYLTSDRARNARSFKLSVSVEVSLKGTSIGGKSKNGVFFSSYPVLWCDQCENHRIREHFSGAAGLSVCQGSPVWPLHTTWKHMEPLSPCWKLRLKHKSGKDIIIIDTHGCPKECFSKKISTSNSTMFSTRCGKCHIGTVWKKMSSWFIWCHASNYSLQVFFLFFLFVYKSEPNIRGCIRRPEAKTLVSFVFFFTWREWFVKKGRAVHWAQDSFHTPLLIPMLLRWSPLLKMIKLLFFLLFTLVSRL